MLRALCLCFSIIWLPWVVLADSQQRASSGGESAVEPRRPSQGRPRSGKGKKSRASAKRLKITPQHEAAAFEFAEQHHPKLTRLLKHLERELPREYDRAIRDLFRTQNRLKGIQQRDAERYRMELQLWRTRSRAQLLSARFQIKPSETLRRQLRAALNTEYDLRQQILERERQRLNRRIRKVDTQLDRLQQNRDQMLARQLSSLTAQRNKAGKAKKRSTKRRSADERPAKKRPSEKRPNKTSRGPA